MIASIDHNALNLAVATLLGAAIGFERQWRQRMAGLRTNTLVAIGAASFVIFAGLVPGDSSPTRVAAQVVSGIGFLGAGIIFREGLQVTGLNTAATLWCSAAVGLLAGSGHGLHAALATSFVVMVNLLLRPLVRLSRSCRPIPIFTTMCAWFAAARKKRMSERCYCKAPATDTSACASWTARILRVTTVSKSTLDLRRNRRATLSSNRL
jgi:uncharacterized membrane protein YhiD involved in acid resistance